MGWGSPSDKDLTPLLGTPHETGPPSDTPAVPCGGGGEGARRGALAPGARVVSIKRVWLSPRLVIPHSRGAAMDPTRRFGGPGTGYPPPPPRWGAAELPRAQPEPGGGVRSLDSGDQSQLGGLGPGLLGSP
ncbi:ran-binding protein 3 [Platysternon megacephalum]|uniref:Ran-binding protein 3 n=1 Tax=Platysternon megacephalum TaxID=55544 RepID=A0A4D9DXZ5_9SAUR|nr:ran-binding protein 3 [Platysternon megacephalum]